MLEIMGLTKRFTSGRGHIAALTDIHFSVENGGAIIIAGRSGSGKTTLLNCIGTLEIPDSGGVVFNGTEVSSLGSRQRAFFRRHGVGFVFQTGNLLPWLTVSENLAFILELNKVYGRRQARRISELLEIFGLSGYDRALPAELSGGEAQRIAFARAIAHTPALLLADEPTASLDSANGRQLIELMFSLCRENRTTLVIATHDQDLMAMTDSLVYLQDGRMVPDDEKTTDR